METVKAETDGVHIDGVLHLQFLYVREDDQTPFWRMEWNGSVQLSPGKRGRRTGYGRYGLYGRAAFGKSHGKR